MAKLYLKALAITFLLPALCEGASCVNGQLDQTQIDDFVLNPINSRREKLVAGTQKNGNSGQNLPPAKGMPAMTWSCDLEKTAIDALAAGDCYDHPMDPQGRAELFFMDYLNLGVDAIKTHFVQELNNIETNAITGVTSTSTQVTYPAGINSHDPLYLYLNTMYTSATEIGCAFKSCPEIPTYRVYCILNDKALMGGDVIYNAGAAGVCNDADCPTGTKCDPTSKLCVRQTTAAPTVATTPSTSPEASFPSGSSTRCPNSRMTDTLRSEYERLHNFRRGLLATGQIPRKDGKYLPKASNMRKITYDCGLEEGAIQYASQCPTTHSEQSSRPNVGENFKTFPATRFTFDTAAKKSVTEWWKPIRDVNYFEKVVVFRPFHDGAPISSFTQMGWATSHLVGCSIVMCSTSNRYVGVCRYSPRGNIVNNNVYEVGTPCSACPTGATSCSSADGLCF